MEHHYKRQMFSIQEVVVGQDKTFIRDLKKEHQLTHSNNMEDVKNPRFDITFAKNQLDSVKPKKSASIQPVNGAPKIPKKHPNRPDANLGELPVTKVNPKMEGDDKPFQGTITVWRRPILLRLGNRFTVLGHIGDKEVNSDGHLMD